MNADQTVQPTSLPAVPSTASAIRALHSSRASPLPSTNAENDVMSATGFLPASQGFRTSLQTQSPFPLRVSTASQLFEREPPQSVAALFSNSPAPTVRVLVRCLPLNTSEESLRLMFVFSKELVNIELQPVERSEDQGFRSAVVRFKTMKGAVEAKNMLDGRSNISNDAEMVVEILASPPLTARRLPTDSASTSTQGTNPSANGLRQPQRFNGGGFPSHERISPTSGAMFPHEFPTADNGGHYKAIFSPQSPIGNHLSERSGVSSKYLINNDFGDDDETTDLLKDPVAYAENGSASQRRATAPQIPIGQMTNLGLNTSNNQAGPSSLPPYINSMSPVNTNGPNAGYPAAGQPYGRHNFPPVNPADQNPPCNTLYVGNLPIDTSEEELKAMFSKQRGYKRLCFRTKQNGPMCFVEFEDVSFATKALHELYGQPLHNSVKGGIRLSFSKNPLGVRSTQPPSQASQGNMAAMNGIMPGMSNGFASANGPPPGLSVPPGLAQSRGNYNVNSSVNQRHQPFAGFTGASGHVWNTPFYQNGMTAAHNGVTSAATTNSNHFPRHMMGR